MERKISCRSKIAVCLVAVLIILLVLSAIFVNADFLTAEAQTSVDYSQYYNKKITAPITSDNIGDYVPLELFNTEGTTVFTGRYYGFVLNVEAATNRVLLFKINYNWHNDGDGYDVIIKVVHEGAYFYTSSTVFTASSAKHLMLGAVDITGNIIDINSNSSSLNSESDDNGAFFVQTSYSSAVTYQTDEVLESFAGVAVSIMGFIPYFGPAITGIYDLCQVCEGLENNWSTSTTLDTSVNFPLTKSGQLASEANGNELIKNLTVKFIKNEQEFLSYDDNENNFIKASFRINDPNDLGYYIQSLISFNVYLRGANLSSVECIGNSKIYGTLLSNDIISQSTQMVNIGQGQYNLDGFSACVPLVNGKVLQYKPQKSGYYKFATSNGYGIKIKDELKDEIAETEGFYYLSSDITYSIAMCSYGEDANWNFDTYDNALIPQNFIRSNPAIAFVNIRRKQDIDFDNPFNLADNDIAYELIVEEESNNSLYKLTADNIDDMHMFILDKDYNIVNSGVTVDGAIYINYPFKSGEVYYLVCHNKGAARDITVTKEGNLMRGDTRFADTVTNGTLYYAVNLPYRQEYTFGGSHSGVYNKDGVKLSANANLYDITAAGIYYIASNNISGVNVGIAQENIKSIVNLNTAYSADTSLNSAFAYTATETLRCTLGSGTSYDIYKDGALYASKTNAVLLEIGYAYHFIKLDSGANITIAPQATAITVGTAKSVSNASTYSVYKFTLTSALRIGLTSSNNLSFTIYNSTMKKVNPNPDAAHGYPLSAGSYYIVINNSGNYTFTVAEKLIPVSISLTVDGKAYADTSGNKYYYGKSFKLPVPTKEGFDFNGWKSGNTMMTDASGNGLNPLSTDKLSLVATWTARSVIMKIDTGTATAKWWTGDKIVSAQPSAVVIEGSVMDQLINLKDNFIKLAEGKKTGHFLKTFTITKTSAQGKTDYYTFTPVWEKEKYFVRFNPQYSSQIVSTKIVTYGEKIVTGTFPDAIYKISVRGYQFSRWLTDNGTQVNLAVNATVPDLTPGYGSEYNYASKGGSNAFDCTSVNLKGEMTLIQYKVTINKTVANATIVSGYTIGKISAYGYKDSDYYGYNVYFEDSSTKQRYYEGGKISNIDRNIVLEVKKSGVTVNISYSDAETSNITRYIVGNGNVALSAGYKRGYEFKNWLFNNNAITQLNVSTLGIKQYYSQSSTPVINKTITANFARGELIAKNSRLHLINYAIGNSTSVYVNCSDTTIKLGATLNIDKDVNEVTFEGNGTAWRDTRIVIFERTSKLTINFSGIKFTSRAGKAAIDATDCPDLELYSYNTCELNAGEASLLENQAAIECRNITFKGMTFKITGGSQIIASTNDTANAATSAIKCTKVESIMIVDNADLFLYGGNGENGYKGKDGAQGQNYGDKGEDGETGYHGGNGAYALHYLGEVRIINDGTLSAKGGNGGNGGKGGTGGKGAEGRNGSFGKAAKAPGNGGNGGAGGKGGNGAVGIKVGKLVGTVTRNQTGSAGEGGKGGAAGQPGDPVKKWNSNNGYSGSPGEKGKDGAAGSIKY